MLSIFKKYPPQNPLRVVLIYPQGPFRLFLHFAHTSPTQIPTGHMLSIFTKYPPRYLPIVEVGTFKKYPSRTQWVNVEWITSKTLDPFHNSHQKVPGRYFVKEPLGFFQKSPRNVLVMCLNHLLWVLWGFFQKAPTLWSKCTRWVFFKEFTKNSQCSSISPQTLKELTKYSPGTFWSHSGCFLKKPSKNSQRVAQAHYECIVRWFLKETEGFFHKVSTRYFLVWIVKEIKGFTCNLTNIYPPGSWWVLSECTHLDDRRVSGWVLCKNTQHVPSGYLGGWSVGEM